MELVDELGQPFGDGGIERADRNRRAGSHGVEHTRQRVAGKRRLPGTKRNSTLPRLNRSVAKVNGLPSTCSGDMKSGVPMSMPACDMRVSSRLRARPKSVRRTRCVPCSQRMLAGLMSR